MDFINRHRIWAAIIALVVVVVVVWSFFGRSEDGRVELPLSEVIAEAQAGNANEIEVRSSRLTVFMNDGREFRSRKESDDSLVALLQNSDVQVGGEGGVVVTVKGGGAGTYIGILITFLPMIFFGGIIFLAVRLASRRN